MPKKKKEKEDVTAEPEVEGGELNMATALLQAAVALDKATQHAVESRDTDSLLTIASLWIKMSNRLGMEEAPAPTQTVQSAGFQVLEVAERPIRDEAEDE